jgi:NAD(P)-dependent dehydrogenase (short-subunit alcohol dehydrogenase family)
VASLSGSVALVTGGASGLGAAIVRALAGAGARVAVNYATSADAASALAAEIGGIPVRADVRDEVAVARMFQEVGDELGPVDLLVNNAGVTRYAPPDDLSVSAAEWERILGVNLVGAWNCVRAAAPGMQERGSGAVVNVASDAAFLLEGSSVPYVISKVGLVALTRVLAGSLAPAIRVHAVAPGWMDTPWLDRYMPDDMLAPLRAGAEPMVDVQRVVAEVLRLLASDTTGEVIRMSTGDDIVAEPG